MEENDSFRDCVIVACGTLSPEINHLKKEGFLDAKKVLFTTPGLHEIPRELENQLIDRIKKAREYSNKIIVVYGGQFCYVNSNDLFRTIDTIIKEQGDGIVRVQASHCVDMLAVLYRKHVFKDWDKGLANENFPKHTGGAIVLDGIGFFDRYVEEHAEELLEYSDWMSIPISPHEITLNRFKDKLLAQLHRLQE
ncbi:MAG: DUF1638 domain-containing protein [Deltaproteobacteria bacterium]|nr:DUF1638 domain-containing protein [Deltaproteobacteria bacterium]